MDQPWSTSPNTHPSWVDIRSSTHDHRIWSSSDQCITILSSLEVIIGPFTFHPTQLSNFLCGDVCGLCLWARVHACVEVMLTSGVGTHDQPLNQAIVFHEWLKRPVFTSSVASHWICIKDLTFNHHQQGFRLQYFLFSTYICVLICVWYVNWKCFEGTFVNLFYVMWILSFGLFCQYTIVDW